MAQAQQLQYQQVSQQQQQQRQNQIPGFPMGTTLSELDDGASNDDSDSEFSQPSSVFSLPVSAITTLTGAPNALEVLIDILSSDQELESLFSIAGSRVDHDKFKRKLSRLVFDFGKGLVEEAVTSEQKLAAKFVQGKANVVAQDIVKKHYAPEIEHADRNYQVTTGLDNHPSSSLDEEDNDISEIGLLISFARSSNALVEFRKSLRSWLKIPEEIASSNTSEAYAQSLPLEDNLPSSQHPGQPFVIEDERGLLKQEDTAARTEDWVNDVLIEDDDIDDPEGLKYDFSSESDQELHSSMQNRGRGKLVRISRCIGWVGYHISRLFDTPIANGKIRVSWRCVSLTVK